MSKSTALTVMQPWANLIAEGVKTEEIRRHRTGHRGSLVICSSQKIDQRGCDLMDIDPQSFEIQQLRGCTICVVDVVDCVQSQENPGMFEWVLENPRCLDPLDVRGKPGLFEIDSSLVIDLEEALAAEKDSHAD